MPGPVYDTHTFVKRLTEVGLPAPVAKVMAAENVYLLASQLATKDDLKYESGALRFEMLERFTQVNDRISQIEHRIDGLAHRMDRLDHRIDQLENRLVMRLGALMLAMQAAALAIGTLF